MEYFRYETTLAVSLPVLHNFLAFRNGTIPGLTRLKAVVMNIEYDSIEEPLIKEIKSSDMVENLRLEVSFNKTTAFPKRTAPRHQTRYIVCGLLVAIRDRQRLTCY